METGKQWDIFKTFQKVKRGEAYNEQTINEMLDQRGLMAQVWLHWLHYYTKRFYNEFVGQSKVIAFSASHGCQYALID